jgi:hypothetical protein
LRSSAVAAALAVAAEHGLRCEEPVVLRDAWHVLVHLRPAPVVARVSTAIPYPEGPHPEDLVRELAVAAHAARAGAAVIPPADELDPGPHRRDGRIVTFWRYVEPQGEVDARLAGRLLRTIHEGLADYDGPLPPAGHPADLVAVLAALEPSDDVDLLRELAGRTPSLDGQALHGDPHLGNCLSSAPGPLWHDFECACRGPREYDLAALVLRDRHSGYPPAREALAAYGPHDADLVDALVPAYGTWVYASMLIALPRRPDLKPLLGERLRWLRELAAL